MQKFLISIISLVAVITGTAFDISSSSGKAGYTGSPGESTCRNCHSSFTTQGAGSIYITSNMPGISGMQYIPGTTYNMIAVVKYTGRGLFGIGLEALNASGSNAGSIVITNSTATSIVNTTVNGYSRTDLIHKSNGGLHNDSAVFQFNWTAPPVNIGNVTFYYAGVMADNNGHSSNDYVANGSTLVTPGSATGITTQGHANEDLQIFKDPSSSLLHLSFYNESVESTVIELIDLNGKIITHVDIGKKSGLVNFDLALPGGIQNGVYIIHANTGSKHLSAKTFVSQ